MVISDEPAECPPPLGEVYSDVLGRFDKLRNLKVRFIADEAATLPLADVIATQAERLEELSITCRGPIPTYVPFGIAAHDLPNLKELNLRSDELESFVDVMYYFTFGQVCIKFHTLGCRHQRASQALSSFSQRQFEWCFFTRGGIQRAPYFVWETAGTRQFAPG